MSESEPFDLDDDALSVLDELPLWAAPFGLRLLDTVQLRDVSAALDVGFGTGFPLLELAMRLGPSSTVHGLDPWPGAHRRTRLKLDRLGLLNVKLHEGAAEAMPFEDGAFDCVVSNNGYNNVSDRDLSFRETARVCRAGAQLVFTLNLEDSFRELHEELRAVLEAKGLGASVGALRAFISRRRPPLEDVLRSVRAAGFVLDGVEHDVFAFRLAKAEALEDHAFFRRYQLPHLREIVPSEHRPAVFDAVWRRLNRAARAVGELRLSVPFVTVSARRRA
jgi:SAM-dependent methyltransferase